VQHIKTILPDMKARINRQMVTLSKELASYGQLTDSKVSGLLHYLISFQAQRKDISYIQ
jgi:hypothetical protein